MQAHSLPGDAFAKRGASKRALALAASTAALIAGLATSAAAAPALPSGGHVGAGSATISTSGATETIDQTSSKAIIDWSSFRVGKSGTVQFDNGSGATLNEVSGGTAQIDGLLSGTGSVYVIDPAGVVIDRSGVVRMGGAFVAATLDPGASSFLTGGPLTFAGASKAAVVNLGKIGSLGGDVALIGRTVANRGQITAARGDVGLAAGSKIVVQDRLLNGGKFSVVLGGAGTSATNTGSIRAAEAELGANGGNVYALAGNAGGTIEATGVARNDGKVFLIAGGGTTVAHGQIDATTATGAGGMVETSGERVNFDGLTVKAGNWLVDPYDLTVNAAAAATISNNLATTNVTLKTTATGASGPGLKNASGVGDIDIDAPISWSSANTLTLDAYHSIDFEAAVTAAGAGKVVLTTNDGGSGGDYGFGLGPTGFAGSLSFTGAPGGGQALTINGQAYTLLYSMADVANVNTTGLGGDYALANSLDASGTTYTAGLIGSSSSPFTGAFTGLGHTISNLTISAAGDDVGLFAATSSTSEINGVGLVGGSVTGGGKVGGLVGWDIGAITNAYATGAVTGDGFDVGGLAGEADGTITNAYATGAVTGNGGNVGGLVGIQDGGSITNAFATGAVTETAAYTYVGGLVGFNSGTITSSYATGALNAPYGNDVGGLVGEDTGTITNAYATGAVTGGYDVGGLVGENYGAMTSDFATGAAAAAGSFYVGGLVGENHGSITDAYATGSVTGGNVVGGLVGENYDAITNAYATGAVMAGGRAVGGLVGWETGTITNSYATGAVTGASNVGGLIGYYGGGALANSHYDIDQVLINGGHELTLGGLYDGQYQDWYSHGLSLDISTYFGSPDANGFYSVNNLTDLQDMLGFGETPGLKFKLTANIDLSSVSGFYIPYFAGKLNGQGNTISNLSLDYNNSDLGLVGVLDGGTIANLGVVGGSVSGLGNVGDLVGYASESTITHAYATGAVYISGGDPSNNNVGGLVGYNAGTITNAYATGAVTASVSFSYQGRGGVGGLVGYDTGAITNAYATGAVSGAGVGSSVGGLAGYADGAITNSYATGTVTGLSPAPVSDTGVGGLVGYDSGAITNAYATGAVTGSVDYVGGLVGDAAGTITNAYATGAVTGSGYYVGGLVGDAAGTITNAYATGAVTGYSYVGGLIGYASDSTITNSYATGAVTGGRNGVGGLVGYDDFSTITNAYATGAVMGRGEEVGGLIGANNGTITSSYATGAVAGEKYVGGLVGYDGSNHGGATITNSYATGAVTGRTALVGGLVGFAEGTITDGYYDTDTSGMPAGLQPDGSVGLTTAQLQGALPAGFSGGVWGTGTGLYPYLSSFYATTPQAISGFAYIRHGVVAKGAQIGIYLGGSLLGGDASSGANGYFYELVPGGTVGTSTRLGETLTLSGATGVSGLFYTDQPTLSSGNVGLNITAGPVTETTADASLSALDADLGATFGSGYAGIASQLGGASAAITATGAGGFTIDQSLTSGGNVAVTTTGGALTIDATVDAGKLTLISAGDIDASGGALEAASLTGSSVGGADFTGSGNLVGALGKFVNTGSGAFSLTDGETLRLNGPLTDTVGGVTLTTTSGALNLAAGIDAAGQTLTLDSAGAISAAPASLRATTLTGSWSGAAILTGAGNRIVALSSFANAGVGGLNLSDGRALTVIGPVTDTTGNVFLTTTSGALTVTGTIDATGRLLTLTSAGAIVTTGATLDYKKLVENPNTP